MDNVLYNIAIQHKIGAQYDSLKPKLLGSSSGTSLKELEARVSSILVSAGKPCRVSEITKDYRLLFGHKFPVYEVGLTSAVEVLKRIPETCEICDESVDPLVQVKITQKNAHIYNLVKKSKREPKPLIEKTLSALKDVFVPFNVQDHIRAILCGRKSIKIYEFFRLLEDRFDLKYMNLQVPVEMLVQSLPHILHIDGGYVKCAYNIDESEIHIPQYLHFEEELIIPSYRLSIFEIQIAQKISLLVEENDELYVKDIPELYVKRFGKELNWLKLGFYDLWRFLRLIPGNFGMVKLREGYVLSPPDNCDSEANDIRTVDARKFCGHEVYLGILEKIKCLVLQVNNGLNIEYLESMYETLYFEKLVLKDFEDFVSELTKIGIFEIKEVDGNVKLYPSRNYHLSSRRLISRRPKPQETEFPEDVLIPGDSLKSLCFPGEINPKNQGFCTAYVTFITTPNDFYLRVVGLEIDHKQELEDGFSLMMADMQEFYSDCSQMYSIPLSLMKIGMVCAACVKGQWQRALITDLVSESRFIVRLLDSGESSLVSLLNLRYLHTSFANLPMVAVKATLFNIRPATVDWDVNSLYCFRTLTAVTHCQPKKLSAILVHQSKDGRLQVVLTMMESGTEIHVADQLVQLGCAEYKYKDETFNGLYF